MYVGSGVNVTVAGPTMTSPPSRVGLGDGDTRTGSVASIVGSSVLVGRLVGSGVWVCVLVGSGGSTAP